MSTADLEQLARWRTLGARHSEEVVELASSVLTSGRLGDQEWSIREQLAIAALDMGQIKLASEQLDLLKQRFPLSPRVTLLFGLRLEASNDSDGARKVYDGLLSLDETNISAHQRLIALSISSPTSTIPLLQKYLDTFYSDPAAWSLLAELYADQGLYGQSLAALGHVMVIQTWDSGAVCRAGETAYTMGDWQLALKSFLRATEMEADPSSLTSEKGTKSRSWWGVKLVTRRSLQEQRIAESAVPPTMTTSLAQLEKLDELATKRLLTVGGAGMGVRRKVLAGESGVDTVR